MGASPAVFSLKKKREIQANWPRHRGGGRGNQRLQGFVTYEGCKYGEILILAKVFFIFVRVQPHPQQHI